MAKPVTQIQAYTFIQAGIAKYLSAVSRAQAHPNLNKNVVGKPYNAVDARHVDFRKFREGVPLWW